MNLKFLIVEYNLAQGNGSHIFTQYLNRRIRHRLNPPGASLLQQFSVALDVGNDFLFDLVEGLPVCLKAATDD